MKLESVGICEPKPSLTEEDAQLRPREEFLAQGHQDSSAVIGKNLTLQGKTHLFS